MRYMLDTNICIHLMRQQSEHAAARIEQVNPGDIVMSVVTLAELRHGVERAPENKRAAEQALKVLLSFIPVAPFDQEAAVSYGVIAAAVRDRRRDALDRLIAAHAISLGVTLVTNNEKDFSDYPGLTVENWIRQPPE